MSTPHVAAAAARVWCLNKTMSNTDIKGLLITSGNQLKTVEDPQFTSSDQHEGYNGDFTGDGPFCWPISMGNASYLNVAAAMGRGVIESEVTDATTGLPLVGATIQALIGNTKIKTIKARGSIASPYENWVDLIDLPDNLDYLLQVSAPGFTSGFQTYDYEIYVDGGMYTMGSSVDIPVPPNNKNYTVVANWQGGYDLGLFLWLPQGSPSAVIGPTDPGSINNPGGSHQYYQGQGTLAAFPYARFYRYEYADGLGFESIGVVSSGNYPKYNSTVGNQIYDVLMTDFYDGNGLAYDSFPYVRVWYGGIPHLLAAEPDGCGGGSNWWHAGSFYRSGNGMKYMYTSDYSCGTGDPIGSGGDGIWPYSTKGGVTVKAMDQPAN
jgi:hypothetical protein